MSMYFLIRYGLVPVAFIGCIYYQAAPRNTWITEKYPHYVLHYTDVNRGHKAEYLQLLDSGINRVEAFFNTPYHQSFDVFIQPNRAAFDSAYRTIYHVPGFQSQCWLVATGDGRRISIIAPEVWDAEPCTDRYANYADRAKTLKLITHELVHVFHGQLNTDPDLTGKNGTDWFIEGLAFYASGQLGPAEQLAVKQAIRAKQVPYTLDSLSNYADVNVRYALWGSLVQYIDKKYGRTMLKRLLLFDKRAQLLAALKINERGLVTEWMGKY